MPIRIMMMYGDDDDVLELCWKCILMIRMYYDDDGDYANVFYDDSAVLW